MERIPSSISSHSSEMSLDSLERSEGSHSRFIDRTSGNESSPVELGGNGGIETPTGREPLTARFSTPEEEQSNSSRGREERNAIHDGLSFSDENLSLPSIANSNIVPTIAHQEPSYEAHLQQAEENIEVNNQLLQNWNLLGRMDQQQEIIQNIVKQIRENHNSLLHLLNLRRLPSERAEELQGALEHDRMCLDSTLKERLQSTEEDGEAKKETVVENVNRALAQMTDSINHAREAASFLRSDIGEVPAGRIERGGHEQGDSKESSMSSFSDSVSDSSNHQFSAHFHSSRSSPPSGEMTNVDYYERESSGEETTNQSPLPENEMSLNQRLAFQHFDGFTQGSANVRLREYAVAQNAAQIAEQRGRWQEMAHQWSTAMGIAARGLNDIREQQEQNNSNYNTHPRHPELAQILTEGNARWTQLLNEARDGLQRANDRWRCIIS